MFRERRRFPIFSDFQDSRDPEPLIFEVGRIGGKIGGWTFGGWRRLIRRGYVHRTALMAPIRVVSLELPVGLALVVLRVETDTANFQTLIRVVEPLIHPDPRPVGRDDTFGFYGRDLVEGSRLCVEVQTTADHVVLYLKGLPCKR